jgi:hypothetical protein
VPKSCHALPRAEALLISNPNVLRTENYWNASRPILEFFTLRHRLIVRYPPRKELQTLNY